MPATLSGPLRRTIRVPGKHMSHSRAVLKQRARPQETELASWPCAKQMQQIACALYAPFVEHRLKAGRSLRPVGYGPHSGPAPSTGALKCGRKMRLAVRRYDQAICVLRCLQTLRR